MKNGKQGKKKIPTSRLALLGVTRRTGNTFLLKDGLSYIYSRDATFPTFCFNRISYFLVIKFEIQSCLMSPQYSHNFQHSQCNLSIKKLVIWILGASETKRGKAYELGVATLKIHFCWNEVFEEVIDCDSSHSLLDRILKVSPGNVI